MSSPTVARAVLLFVVLCTVVLIVSVTAAAIKGRDAISTQIGPCAAVVERGSSQTCR